MPGRIHVKACDKMKIASELVKRRICDWIPLEKVYKIRGTPILNGLFGVGKPSFLQDGRQVLRLIMNLTGSNATQEQLTGGCIGLPFNHVVAEHRSRRKPGLKPVSIRYVFCFLSISTSGYVENHIFASTFWPQVRTWVFQIHGSLLYVATLFRWVG